MADEDEEEMIAKKEVLERAEITYGQFYRWKRKGLIPEGWFERRSTFTGQETFLPQAKILERLARIKALKDDHSLEEIAELLSPQSGGRPVERADLEGLDWISPEVLEYYATVSGQRGPFSFADLLQLALLEQLQTLDLAPEEIALALATLRADLQGEQLSLGEARPGWLLLVIRKEIKLSLLSKQQPTVGFCCLVPSGQFQLDPESQVAAQLDLNRLREETKMRMRREA